MSDDNLRLRADLNYSERDTPQKLMTTLLPLMLVWACLLLAWWAAGSLRLSLAIGAPLGDTYRAIVPVVPVIELGAVLAVNAGLAYCRLVQDSTRYLFMRLCLSAGLSALLVVLLLPDISRLQMIYFVVIACCLAVVWFLLPQALYRRYRVRASLWHLCCNIWTKRQLLRLWLRYRIEDRYSQMWLGIVWIVLLPISEALVIAFVFSQLLRGSLPGFGAPFVVFLLTGLTYYSIFDKIVRQSPTAFVTHRNLIARVYFPREVILFLLIGEVLVDWCFVFGAMLLVNLAFGIVPHPIYITAIIPLMILAGISLGITFFLSVLSLLVRDLQQLIGVFMALFFYLTVLYFPARMSYPTTTIIELNPILQLLMQFRDIIIAYQHPFSMHLVWSGLLMITLLQYGYLFFKVNENHLADNL
jgi:ABC-type polysaccharide/polyol phosphate export permease